jgi:hypothetical protein
MVRIPLPGLPDINVNLPDLPDLPDIPGIGLWRPVQNIDVEKEFWELVDKIDEFTLEHRLPVPTLRPVLTQLSLIDSDKLRAVAKVWGTSDADLGVPATVGHEVPKKVNEAIVPLAERWEGQAYTNFKQWMGELNGVVDQYGAPAHLTGTVLNDLAEQFDLSWLEIIGLIMSIAGLVTAVAGFAAPEFAVSKAAAIVGTVVGAIGAYLDLVVSVFDSALPRIEAAKAAHETLTQKVNNMIPPGVDEHVRLPNRNQWRQRTADPNS